MLDHIATAISIDIAIAISNVNLKLEVAATEQVQARDQGRWPVAVQLNTRLQNVGDGEAGGGKSPAPWRPQPAPSRRPGAMIMI
jgi:hypothetical protein